MATYIMMVGKIISGQIELRVADATKEIPLTQGYVAIVDAADYEWLNQWKWHAKKGAHTYYAARTIHGGKSHATISMHRAILNAPIGTDVDHVDGDGLNNRRGNLRLCTRGQNNRNARTRKDNASGLKGVRERQTSVNSPWESRITFDGKTYLLGYFPTAKDAGMAHDEAARILHGEFAKLNFADEIPGNLLRPGWLTDWTIRMRNTSGFRGVHWDKERKLWQAGIQVRGKTTRLGRFVTAEDAARAYDAAAKNLLGAEAKLNFAMPPLPESEPVDGELQRTIDEGEMTAELEDWMEDVEWMRRGM